MDQSTRGVGEPASPVAASPAPASDSRASDAGARAASRGPGHREGASDAEAATTLNQIRYPCLMNMDYHGTREAWLDTVHRWLMFLVIGAGASAFIDAWPAMRLIGPIVAVVCGALDLTFDLSNRARSHSTFRRRYSDILVSAAKSPDALARCKSQLDELSGDEEPPYHAQLALSAMKAQQATYGRVVDPCRPGYGYRMLANVWRFDGHDFNQSSTSGGRGTDRALSGA